MSLTFSDRQEIISLCKQKQFREPGFQHSRVFKSYFVKFGCPGDVKFQYKTQEYIHSMTLNDPSAPRVPKVVEYFTVEPYDAYLVMELIEGSAPADNANKKVADAVQWLYDIPAPTGAKIGSIGGGPARHDIFQDFEAPLLFTSNEALQNYVNKGLQWLPGSPKPAEVNFSNDKLVFTQSKMNKRNFLVDKNGKICILGFENIVLLPESFARYTLSMSCDPLALDFVQKVNGYLEWPPSPNEDSMGWARRMLLVMGDRTLGLDADGLPVRS